jgi:hypothetical protein
MLLVALCCSIKSEILCVCVCVCVCARTISEMTCVCNKRYDLFSVIVLDFLLSFFESNLLIYEKILKNFILETVFMI